MSGTNSTSASSKSLYTVVTILALFPKCNCRLFFEEESMKNYMWLLTTFVLLTGLILAGCSSDGQDASNVDGSPEPVPPIAVVKAREAVAAVFDMRASSIGVESYERAVWQDSCLGLGGPAESCLAALHPGWLVMLDVDGDIYEVRTDETGDIVRIKE